MYFHCFWSAEQIQKFIEFNDKMFTVCTNHAYQNAIKQERQQKQQQIEYVKRYMKRCDTRA